MTGQKVYQGEDDAMSAELKHATDELHAAIGDDVRRHYEEARAGLHVSELAVLAGRHLSIQQCAGGHSVVAGGPCDHCGSTDPANQCNFVQIGTPLIT